jgi:ketosteroid isomerase-like protein
MVGRVTDWRADLCYRSYAAWVAEDSDALIGLFAENCEWNVEAMAATGIGPVYRGHEGLRRFMREITADWEAFEPVVLELRAADERLLVRGSMHGRNRALGIDVASLPFGQVVEFTDRKVLRVTQTDDPPPGWADAMPVAESP